MRGTIIYRFVSVPYWLKFELRRILASDRHCSSLAEVKVAHDQRNSCHEWLCLGQNKFFASRFLWICLLISLRSSADLSNSSAEIAVAIFAVEITYCLVLRPRAGTALKFMEVTMNGSCESYPSLQMNEECKFDVFKAWCNFHMCSFAV